MSFADRLKELRSRKGESLQQVAYAIAASKAHIWELESGKSNNPSLDLLQRLAYHFNTNVSYLIEERDASGVADFISRNSEKLGSLGDAELDLVERLLEVLAQKPRER